MGVPCPFAVSVRRSAGFRLENEDTITTHAAWENTRRVFVRRFQAPPPSVPCAISVRQPETDRQVDKVQAVLRQAPRIHRPSTAGSKISLAGRPDEPCLLCSSLGPACNVQCVQVRSGIAMTGHVLKTHKANTPYALRIALARSWRMGESEIRSKSAAWRTTRGYSSASTTERSNPIHAP